MGVKLRFGSHMRPHKQQVIGVSHSSGERNSEAKVWVCVNVKTRFLCNREVAYAFQAQELYLSEKKPTRA